MPEVDAMLSTAAEASTKPAGPEDETPTQAEVGEPVTKLGDRWRLGRHSLMCGDAKDPVVVERLMEGQKADMAYLDPPYGCAIQGHVSGLGRVRHREFVEGSDRMTPTALKSFLLQGMSSAALVCRDGAIVFVCIDWRGIRAALEAAEDAFTEVKNVCVWSKTNSGVGTFYRSQHELIIVCKVGTAPHTNTFGLGDKGRHRTNVWVYPGVNGFKAGRMEELALHPTCKPVAMVADAIRDVSHRGETLLDLFGGSGTTLIAAEKTGRVARILELDPLYCDVMVRRWEKFTGKIAVREEAAPAVAVSKGWGQ